MNIPDILSFIEVRIVWSPVLVVLLLGTGLFLTIRLRFMSIRRLPAAIGLAFQNKSSDNKDGEISPRAALFTALSATVGTGNIAGVATAIAIGGPGAIFWMWMTAIFGMATKYSEAVLAVKFREVDERGEHVGGPMYYIKNGLGKKWMWLAFVFAICTAVAAPGTGNLIQSNEVAGLFKEHLGIPRWVSGLGLALLVFSVIIGGIKSIAKVASAVVPLMALGYIAAALFVLFFNAAYIPDAFAMIFKDAFTGSAAAGGFLGASIMYAMQKGADRGSFSNEAGLGSAAIAHAAAKTNDPVRQGTIAMLGCVIDTLIICTMTALVILTAPAVFEWVDPKTGVVMTGLEAWKSGLNGAQLTSAAFEAAFSGGKWVVTFGLAVFAFTTILGWAFYGERAVEFLLGTKAIIPYRVLWCVIVYCGAVLHLEVAWSVAGIGNGLMAGPNLIALLALSGTIVALSKAAGVIGGGDKKTESLSEEKSDA